MDIIKEPLFALWLIPFSAFSLRAQPQDLGMRILELTASRTWSFTVYFQHCTPILLMWSRRREAPSPFEFVSLIR
jgi:hypothetical protein